jgi:hypothetical protein
MVSDLEIEIISKELDLPFPNKQMLFWSLQKGK